MSSPPFVSMRLNTKQPLSQTNGTGNHRPDSSENCAVRLLRTTTHRFILFTTAFLLVLSVERAIEFISSKHSANTALLGAKLATLPLCPGIGTLRAKTTFDGLLKNAQTGPALIQGGIGAIVPIMDLAVDVRASKIQNKEALVDSLVQFRKESKQTPRELHKLYSVMRTGVDVMLATTNRVLYGAQATQHRAFPPSLLSLSHQMNAEKTTASVPDNPMTIHIQSLSRIVSQIDVALTSLRKLEKLLIAIDIHNRTEYTQLVNFKAGMFARLSTKMAIYDRESRELERSLELLRVVEKSTKKTSLHINATSQVLLAMRDDMEALKAWMARCETMERAVLLWASMRFVGNGLDCFTQEMISVKEMGQHLVNLWFFG